MIDTIINTIISIVSVIGFVLIHAEAEQLVMQIVVSGSGLLLFGGGVALLVKRIEK